MTSHLEQAAFDEFMHFLLIEYYSIKTSKSILVLNMPLILMKNLENHKYFFMENEDRLKAKLVSLQDRLEAQQKLTRQRNYATLKKIEQVTAGFNERILALEDFNQTHQEQNWEVFLRYMSYVLLLCSNIFTILYNTYPDSKTYAWTASGSLIGLSLMTAIEILRPIIKWFCKGCKKKSDKLARRQETGQQLTERRFAQPNNRP